jgi:hypothetical protein
VTAPLLALFASLLLDVRAAEPPNASSVHLRWTAPDGVAFYNELTVRASVPGSYFMATGFSRGYFGIQELPESKARVAIFSVWDPDNQDDLEADPMTVPIDRQVKVHGSGPGVEVARFGSEGTGARAMVAFPWKLGETVRFFVRATPRDNHTVYAAYIQREGAEGWLHMATLETWSGGEPLRRYYSFVEDFRRDGTSRNEARRAEYGNGWVQTAGGEWHPLLKARFTRDDTPSQAISGGVTPANRFYLATGGDTQPFVAPDTAFSIPAPVGQKPQIPQDHP